MSNLSLADAIANNDLQKVAECLDRPKVVIDEEALMAMVKLAWKTRGGDEDPVQQAAAEGARQIYDMLLVAGANFNHPTPRGTIIERIAKVQPDWPIGNDRPPEANRRETQVGRPVDEIEEEFGVPRVARGAMHRHRPR